MLPFTIKAGNRLVALPGLFASLGDAKMAGVIQASDLRGLLAELSAQADAGDDDAATALNALALKCDPAVLLEARDDAAVAAGEPPTPPPLIRTVTTDSMEPVGAVFNNAPWHGPVGMVTVKGHDYRQTAARALAEHIAIATRHSFDGVLAVLDTLDPDFAVFLDSQFGWALLADMVADKLGILDAANPLLSFDEAH